MTSELLLVWISGSVNTCSPHEQRHSVLFSRGGIGSVECMKINRDKVPDSSTFVYCVSVNWY